MMHASRLTTAKIVAAVVTSTLVIPKFVFAQGGTSALLEEVVVTARKREESSQDVPISITAFAEEQLEVLKVRDLGNLSVGMPNVALDDIGTAKGTANFSIRGLGVNSSIPSIDPTVGVFVDGVYMGVNSGIVFDMFDIASIEVLRGPQGILFGRNVTGGAVLLNTKKPSEEFEGKVRAAYDKGKRGAGNSYLMASIGGPVSDTLSAKFTAYYNDDKGGLENLFTGEDHGAIEQKMFRPVVVWTPNDATELVLRYEHSESEGDGPPSQNHTNGSGVPGNFANFPRDSFDFSIDEPGFQENETDFFAAELNIDVAFGDGTITNIFGWRDILQDGLVDVDSQPVWLFHAPNQLRAEQFSNELRYSGRFADKATVTTGLYYFTNDLQAEEQRELLGIATGGVGPALTLSGGGDYQVKTVGVFAAVDYDMNDNLTLTAGLRYTDEEKEAKIASLSLNATPFGVPACSIIEGLTCAFDFVDEDSWTSLSPKIGFSYHLSDNARYYGHWSRGFRSGGYNLRNTSFNPADVPGPFDEETVDNFEIGYKSTFARGRLNTALFYNKISDMQRELNLPSQGAGVVQLIRNTADADILGIEVDLVYSLTDKLLLTTSVGYIDPEYSNVTEDLNTDGLINEADENLDLPRAAKLTYSIGLTHDLEIGSWGYMTSRASYAFRDESAYTDSNLGIITEQKILDAGIDFRSNDGQWTYSFYGRNLLDEVRHGGDTQLPDVIGPVPTGGAFAPISKGRLYGIEATYKF